MRISTVVLLSATAFAAAAAPASGAVVSGYDAATDTLTVTSDAAADTVAVTCPAASLLVNGANPSTGALACTGGPAPATVLVLGNGGNDTLDVSGLEEKSFTAVTVDGGDGDDEVTGVYLASNGQVVTVTGGPGADTITVNAADVAEGGPGDDRIVGPVQADGTLSGNDGTDTFAFELPASSAVSFTFTLNATGVTIGAPGVPQTQTMSFASIEAADLVLGDASETVDAKAFPGSVRVDARGGADTLIGGAGGDTLNGGVGNDFLDGAGGADVLLAGAGLDLVHARDGVADTGDCGTEDDTLVADGVDAFVGCERVDLPVGPPPPADTVKPALAVKRATLQRRTLRVRVSCPAGEVRCAGVLKLSGVGRRAGATVRVALGAVTFQIAGGKSATLTKRLPRKRARTLDRLRRARLRVVLDVVDAAGNRTERTARIRLRR
jgi:Ca2+-binding RTX toxin-like protein